MKYQIKETKLKNSARMLSVHSPGSKTFYIQIYFRSGSIYAPKGKYEIAHLMEHMAFLGNKKVKSKQDFAYEIEKNGAYMNAHTSSELLSYDYICAMHEYEVILELALAQIFEPLIPQDAIESEKKVIVSELKRKQNNDNFRKSYDGTYRNMYQGILSIEDRIASLQNINRQDMVSFHKELHNPANMTIVVSGDLPGRKITQITKMFETAAPQDSTKHQQKRKTKLRSDYKQKVVLQKNTQKDQNFFTFSLIDPHYHIELESVFRIFNAMYSEGDFARMFLQAREKGLSYGVGADFGTAPEVTTFSIYDQTETGKLDELLRLCLSELKKILDGDFSQKEFDRAKGYVIGRFARHYELSQEVAEFSEVYYIEDNYKIYTPDDAIAELQRVKPQDIVELKEILLQKNNWLLSIVGENLKGKEKYFTQLVQSELFSD